MQTNLRGFLQHKKLDDFPLIAEARTTHSTTGLRELLSKSNFTENPNDVNPPFMIAPHYIYEDLNTTLLKLDAGLLDITRFYFHGIDTWFGPKPFESFILNKTYREDIWYPVSRQQFFNDFANWCPFLREVIIDTCNFILTGRRDIHIKVLRDLSMSYNEAAQSCRSPMFPELNVKQRFDWKDIEGLTSQEFFTAWVSQKNGIQDLICSYKVMLGL